MPLVAIIGAGALGGALAHKLAVRSRVTEVRLIDDQEAVARGKALDILQAGPVEGFGTLVTGHGTILAGAGADAIVIADTADGEHSGEAGLALIRRLESSGRGAPVLFAGVTQRELMSRCGTELGMPPTRLLGSAPLALASALRALSAVVLDCSAVEISLNVVGVPPKHAVVGWQEATVSGQPLTGVMAAHDIAALTARIDGLWPPGPYSLASAAARVAEGVCWGSRRRYTCFVDVGRGRIVAMPVELKRGGISRVIEPVLTSKERTLLENAFAIR
jgi:malate dehydrogenase